jgi:hypothetical protein
MKNRSKRFYKENNEQPKSELMDALKDSLSVLIQVGIETLSEKLTKKMLSRR